MKVIKGIVVPFALMVVVLSLCLVGCVTPSANNDENARNDELNLEIVKGEALKDLSLKPAFAVTIDFENHTERDNPFDFLYKVVATQDGEELSKAYFSGTEGTEAIETSQDIEPGAQETVQKIYVLKSASPVVVEVYHFLEMSGTEVLVSRQFDVEKEYNYMVE